MRRTDRASLRAPARVVDLELEDAPRGEIPVEGFNSIWCLVRRQGIPVDITFWELAEEVRVPVSTLEQASQDAPIPRGYQEALAGAAPAAPDVTVVVCTRRRTDGLAQLLHSLQLQEDHDFTLLVVNNDAQDDTPLAVVRAAALPRSRYVVEARPGLSRARNQGLRQVATEVVAWIDDDEVADANWVGWLKQGFRHPARPAAVAGLMLPAQLGSEAQVRFEQYGGFNKGRGLEPEVLRAGAPTVHHPLYPLPSFGPGGNMAFRTEALRRLGGFDPYLGAGTRTHGGEETRAFSQLLSSGEAVLHWPAAMTWHFHRWEMEALRTQFFGYSAGLSAFYASTVRSRPAAIFDVARLAPHALGDLRQGGSNQRLGHLSEDFPKELLRQGRRGLLLGAFLYTYERVRRR